MEFAPHRTARATLPASRSPFFPLIRTREDENEDEDARRCLYRPAAMYFGRYGRVFENTPGNLSFREFGMRLEDRLCETGFEALTELISTRIYEAYIQRGAMRHLKGKIPLINIAQNYNNF